ncbi:calcium-binding protein, partial [Nodularia spumigena]|uniref:calcium-binding protein n=1 Tax=Nodularia spumigena TaxID=70799 RepID=UPI002B3E15C7|nr:hypothetical protein [Nodularia spumigena CH309]
SVWTMFQEIEGWTADDPDPAVAGTPPIEIQHGRIAGAPESPDGWTSTNNVIELDSGPENGGQAEGQNNAVVSQTFTVFSAGTYALSFDYSARTYAGMDGETSAFSIRVDGETVYANPDPQFGWTSHWLTLDLGVGNHVISLVGEGIDNRHGALLDNIELVQGSTPVRDLLTGEVFGGPTNEADTLTGTAGDDAIAALDGADLVGGGDGNDTLEGDAGNDTLDGGSGNDLLNGGTGDDVLSGGEGKDTLVGGAGNDALHADAADTVVDGGEGEDTLHVGSLSDLDGMSIAGIEVLVVDGVTAPAAGANLLINADFEDVTGFNHGSWGTFTQISGWTAEDLDTQAPGVAPLEIQVGTQSGAPAGWSSTNKVLELDSHADNGGAGGHTNVKATQSFTVFQAGTHTLSFDFAARMLGGQTATTSEFSIQIDGETVYTKTDAEHAWRSDWFTIDLGVGRHTLTFIGGDADGTSDTYGALIDNIELVLGTEPVRDLIPDPVATPTEGNDTLVGTDGNDTIAALGGNDVVSGGSGNDLLNGGTGDDVLS